jgi:hypothetical protein
MGNVSTLTLGAELSFAFPSLAPVKEPTRVTDCHRYYFHFPAVIRSRKDYDAET